MVDEIWYVQKRVTRPILWKYLPNILQSKIYFVPFRKDVFKRNVEILGLAFLSSSVLSDFNYSWYRCLKRRWKNIMILLLDNIRVIIRNTLSYFLFYGIIRIFISIKKIYQQRQHHLVSRCNVINFKINSFSKVFQKLHVNKIDRIFLFIYFTLSFFCIFMYIWVEVCNKARQR